MPIVIFEMRAAITTVYFVLGRSFPVAVMLSSGLIVELCFKGLISSLALFLTLVYRSWIYRTTTSA